MVIDPNNIGNATSTGARGKPATEERTSVNKQGADTAKLAQAKDSVSLSSEAQSIAKLEQAVAAEPSMDTDRIRSLKSALHSGNYRVDAEAIAQKMLDQDD